MGIGGVRDSFENDGGILHLSSKRAFEQQAGLGRVGLLIPKVAGWRDKAKTTGGCGF